MSYRAQLYPWCVVRCLPKMQNAIVARCRSRNEAEEHVKVLRRMVQGGEFAIAFDLPRPDLSRSNLPRPADSLNPNSVLDAEPVVALNAKGQNNQQD